MIFSTGHNPSLSRHRVDVDSTFAQTDDARTYNTFELPREIDELAIPLIARHDPSGINHWGKTTLISRSMKRCRQALPTMTMMMMMMMVMMIIVAISM
jgi:hypothetical protein